MDPSRPRPGRILAFVVLGGILIAGAILGLRPQKFLTIESGDVKADAIVVLGGGYTVRAERGAELFLQGAAPKILVSGRGDSRLYSQVLEQAGVPLADIICEEKSADTLQNAQFSVPLLRRLGARRVILVTTWFHSRRALACFEHVAPDLTFYSRPTYFGYPWGDWLGRGLDSNARDEFVKLPGYWLRYGVRPIFL